MANPLPQQLSESLPSAPIVRMGEYDYFVHPLSDGVPQVTAPLLAEVVQALSQRLPSEFDAFLTAEAMGLPLVAGLCMATGKPYHVARKRTYQMPGEIQVPYKTGYASGQLHINGLRAGQRIVIVDDVVSKGGTLLALSAAIRQAGANLVKVLVVFSKEPDLETLSRRLGAPVEALALVRVAQGRLQENGP